MHDSLMFILCVVFISSIFIAITGYSGNYISTTTLHGVYGSNETASNKTSVVVETMNFSSPEHKCYILTADRLFDGYILYPNEQQPNTNAVLIKGEKVVKIGTFDNLKKDCNNRVSLGNSTIMPGFIESHAHITFGDVLKDKVLEHGITTARDTDGPPIPT